VDGVDEPQPRGDLGQRTDEHPGIGPVREGLPASFPVLGVRVRGVQRLQVDNVVRDADPVVAEFVGRLGKLNDLPGVQEGAADVELHCASCAQAGSMKTPSASTVTPSESEMVPRAKTLRPSLPSTHASQRSGPSGVPRRYFTVIVPVKRAFDSPSLAASPSMWSSTRALTPPCTSLGGPSYADPRTNSLQQRPAPSWWTTSGGAI